MRIAILVAMFLIQGLAPAVAGTTGEVWKTPTCRCCSAWVKHIEEHGFKMEVHSVPRVLLRRLQGASGVPREAKACHSAKIGGYVIEGHVPAEDIKRLLAERPDAIGLSVPGMPVGSPGMEMPDGMKEPYSVLMIKKDGTTEVFATH